ncbi:MAG TPA: hypothetical protein PLO56_02650 [Rhodothermales bacterium]|nr:hypothetical protein [Rhodothermales bacterium]
MHQTFLKYGLLWMLLFLSVNAQPNPHGVFREAQSSSLRRIAESGRMTAMYQAQNGALWIGMDTGIFRFRNVEAPNEMQPLLRAKITAIQETRNKQHDTIWFGTSQGLYTWQEATQQLKRHEAFGTQAILALAQDRDALWIATEQHLYRLKQGNSKPETQLETFALPQNLPQRLYLENLHFVGNQLFLTYANHTQIYCFDIARKQYATLPINQTLHVSANDGQYLWLGTKIGLWRFEPQNGNLEQKLKSGIGSIAANNKQVAVSTDDGVFVKSEANFVSLHPEPMIQIGVDAFGRIWGWAQNKFWQGQLTPNFITTFNKQNQRLKSDFVYAMTSSANGNGLWIANQQTISYLKQPKNTSSHQNVKLSDTPLSITQLIADDVDANTFYLTDEFRQFYKQKDNKTTLIRKNVEAFTASESEQTLWLLEHTEHGRALIQWRQGNEIARHNLPSFSAYTNAIWEHQGQIWMSTVEKSVYRYDIQQKRLSSIKGCSNTPNTIFKDTQNTIWVGSSDGLARISGDKCVAIPQVQAKVLAITASQHDPNALWFSAETSPQHFAIGRYDTKTNTVHYLTEGSGVLSLLQVRSATSFERNVCFGSLNGAICIDTSESISLRKRYENATNLLIHEVSSGDGAISLNFALQDFSESSLPIYEAFLEDTHCKLAPSFIGVLSCSGLSHGSYLLHVNTVDRWGNRITKIQQISIWQPFYRRFWVQISFVLGILILGYVLWRWRKKRLQAKFKAEKQHILDAEEEIRQNLIKQIDERITVRLHSNVKTDLNNMNWRIKDILDQNQVQSIQQELHTISKLSQQVQNELDVLLRERTFQENMTYPKFVVLLDQMAHFYTQGTGVKYEAPPYPIETLPHRKLDSKWCEIVQRILKQAIANALEHAQATQLILKLEPTDATLAFHLQDNGKGFDVDNCVSDGYGLREMQSAVQNLGGKWEIRSQIGKGTTVSTLIQITYSGE